MSAPSPWLYSPHHHLVWGGVLVSAVQLCLGYPIQMHPLPLTSLLCALCRWNPTPKECPSRWGQTCWLCASLRSAEHTLCRTTATCAGMGALPRGPWDMGAGGSPKLSQVPGLGAGPLGLLREAPSLPKSSPDLGWGLRKQKRRRPSLKRGVVAFHPG